MFVSCKIRGHDYAPYRHRVVEFIPTHNKPDVNRDGAQTLTHVYCKRCGLVKEVVLEDGNVKYRNIVN